MTEDVSREETEAGTRHALQDIIRGLRMGAAYPHPVDDVRVLHTHVSVVFLAGDFAYKVKKPVDLGFLDFTTLDRRRHFCHEEVRLNRRLAPDVYHGVVPIIAKPDPVGSEAAYRIGEATVEEEADGVAHDAVPDATDKEVEFVEDRGEGASAPSSEVEYAVKMRRLPANATMLELLRRGELTGEMVDRVADRVAEFHRDAPGGAEAAAYGRWRVVVRNALENLRQTRDHVGRTVSGTVYDRTREATERELRSHQELIEDRSRRGVPRDTHGDLHLDHVYFLPDRSPPDDLVVIDCIEFNRRFRYADPVADLAFLAMDLAYRGRRDLADRLVDRYFEARDDPGGSSLLPFYVSYRALVRAKVRGIAAGEDSVPLEERKKAVRHARGYWLLALGELVEPGERPGLVLVGGLPGTGKSTFARGLSEVGGFEVVSSDRQRKRLAGLEEEDSAAATFGAGIYTPEWTRRTYAACLRSAAHRLCAGGRVIVDATFRENVWRERFFEMARNLGVRHCFLIASCSAEVVRERIDSRGPDPSDADWEVHRKVADRWEEPSGETPHPISDRSTEVNTGSTPEEAVAQGIDILRRLGLLEDAEPASDAERSS